MAFSYDFHIHSCLSPCGDDDMTPANIAGMASVKGLSVIAVTDHNSCKNCPAVLKAAEDCGITAIAGMELCTAEEVHVVCLFKSLEAALDFDSYVHRHIMPIKNRPDIFGRQQIMDENDCYFQTCELGKVDVGGGGTIAYIMANKNMDVIDAGIAVQNMHAPCEVVSKADVYEAYRAYIAFLKDMD